MSFEDCLNDAMDEGSADRERGRRAQEEWRTRSDRYERQGHPRHTAEALAAEDVKAGFRKEAGETRHVYLARMADMRKAMAEVGRETKTTIKNGQTRKAEQLDYQQRSLVRRFNGRLASFLKEHHRDILGNVTKPAQMRSIVMELHGEVPGDAAAAALAKGIREALEDMRLMFNEAGGIIGKLDNWGLPHSHNRLAVSKAGFDKWYGEIEDGIDWTRIEDNLTGKPFQMEGGEAPSLETKRLVLREVYDNIAFGRESKDAVYGRPKGVAKYRQHAESRVLHFKSSDDWIAYNKKFGTGDPFKSLMGHVHGMARDIVQMREYGPNPRLGAEYRQQLYQKKVRDLGDEKLAHKVEGNGKHAMRMIKILSGSPMAEGPMQEVVATFFSNARHLMSAAFLDRAIFASVSDINSMRLAASSIGMNPANLLSRHVDLLKSKLSREDAMRAGWVADTLSDAGTALSRFQQEVPPSEVFERLASGSMRLQGLSHWTDTARMAFQMEMGGLFASQAGKALDQVVEPLRGLLTAKGITADDWAHFTNPEGTFTAGNGATFISPIYWREATSLPYDQAENIFFKIQSLVEEQTEYAVPTQNVWMRGFVEGYDAPPGSIGYEIAKSGLMFKSFAMTFSVNQYRRLMSQPTLQGRAMYAANLAGGAAIMGAIALQLGDLAMGRDPQPMDNAAFWGRATLKGGGFGILGDIVTAGQASFGGGFPSYVAGPVPAMAGDVYGLTIKNAYEFATGQDTNFAEDLTRFGKRYTPMGQTPLIGPALDRIFWDQLQLMLDPESVSAMRQKAGQRTKTYGNEDFWLPGKPLPSRAPDLGAILRG